MENKLFDDYIDNYADGIAESVYDAVISKRINSKDLTDEQKKEAHDRFVAHFAKLLTGEVTPNA
ncbi:MAG: hypothetical protein IJ889_00165 [Eubacterium sp.]|nr:hypothetical protein [Eubacterium sp.]MBR2247311.1 hypothetical protein [Bacilli bacterium]